MLWYQKLYSELLHRLWVSMMMMMMLSDKGFWLDHDQIEDSEGGCILLPAQETIHIMLPIISDYRAVQLMIFLALRVISSWLRQQWLSCPLVRSTKQCSQCSSHRIALLSCLYDLHCVTILPLGVGGISSSQVLFFALLVVLFTLDHSNIKLFVI